MFTSHLGNCCFICSNSFKIEPFLNRNMFVSQDDFLQYRSDIKTVNEAESGAIFGSSCVHSSIHPLP